MIKWELKGRTLEFDEESHLYIVDGIIVPSVTQVLSKKFPNKYSSIPPAVLKAAADKGTSIHKMIENYCKGEEISERCVKHYQFLENAHNFKAVENEIPVIVELGDNTYAGRLDMIININGKYAVADIKTTCVLDKEYLGLQLNLYRIGVEQCYDYKIEELYGIHIRDDTRKLVKIPIKGEEWLLKSLTLTETE